MGLHRRNLSWLWDHRYCRGGDTELRLFWRESGRVMSLKILAPFVRFPEAQEDMFRGKDLISSPYLGAQKNLQYPELAVVRRPLSPGKLMFYKENARVWGPASIRIIIRAYREGVPHTVT